MAVQRRDLHRDRLAQRRHPGHRRVLVQAAAHRGIDRIDQTRVAIEIRKALAEVDRAVRLRERRHHREDRGADFRQAARDGRRFGEAAHDDEV
jgi:hypothetical protein